MEISKSRYLPLWGDYMDLFENGGLSLEDIGKLVYSMMQFYFQDKEPEDLPLHLKCCWSLLRTNMLSAKNRYEAAVNNGKKGGRPKKEKPSITQHNPEKPIQEQEQNRNKSNNKNIDTRSAASLPEGREGISVEKQSFGEFGWVKLSQQQYRSLGEEMGFGELDRCITYVDEAAQSTGNVNRWKDWYLLVRRCHRDGWHQKPMVQRQEIPKGASGVLGDAELEAIQRVLSQDDL